jgi:hypothetical protein
MREALKPGTAERRAAATRARLIEKTEASGHSSPRGVNPLERAGLVTERPPVRRGLALVAAPPRRGRASGRAISAVQLLSDKRI